MSAATGSLAEIAPLWDPEQDDRLVCRAVWNETHDVKTFVFAAPSPRRFRFLPGQFMTFGFPLPGGEVERCYTIASPPTRPDRIQITVKRQPGGLVSPWLHAEMRAGIEVKALGPLGEFTASDPAEKYLLLSGGSGITPLMAMTRAFADLAAPVDLVFLHSARSPADVIFRDELAMLARRSQGLRLAFICEEDAGDSAYAGYRGRLTPALLALAAPDFMTRRVFACGPAPYMAAIRAMLTDAGFDMRRHHEESFDFAAPEVGETVGETASAGSAVGAFRVTFAKSDRVIECPADMAVLEAARRAGLRLPSSCTRGLCGTCKSQKLSGEVAMTHAGGIRQREIDKGLVLLCCSRPLSDLVIDR